MYGMSWSERRRGGRTRVGRHGRLLGSLALLAAVTVVPWVAAGPVAAQTGKRVETKIIDFGYDPNPVRVDVGTTVTWTNTGARPHTVTDRGGTFDTKPVQPGRTGSVTFSAPGRYQFFCRINPSKMNGVVVVGDGGKPGKVTRVQATDPALPGAPFGFDPVRLSVAAGGSVLFANVGGKPHTLTADDGSFDTGVVNPGPEGGRFAGHNAVVTATKAGTFKFHCEIHPDKMRGVLVVVGGPDATAEPPPEPASNAPRQATVDVKDFAFAPPDVSVAPGGQVTFRNTGAAPHTATFDDVPLDTRTVDPGGQAVLKAPAKPGTYSYKCNIHPARMRGVLTVVGENEADPNAAAGTGGAGAGAAPPAAGAAGAGGGGGRGGGGALSWFALTTAVLGAFAGGIGVAAFARGRPATR